MTRAGHSTELTVYVPIRGHLTNSCKSLQMCSTVENKCNPAIMQAKPEPPPEPKRPRHEEKENVMVPTFQKLADHNAVFTSF